MILYSGLWERDTNVQDHPSNFSTKLSYTFTSGLWERDKNVQDHPSNFSTKLSYTFTSGLWESTFLSLSHNPLMNV
jgi:hypothetical protein